MKRQVNGVFSIVFLMIFLLSGCVHPSVNLGKFNNKRLVSADPKLYIDRVANHPSQWGDEGELTLENGEAVKIVFRGMHGKFHIYAFREDGIYETDAETYFEGTYYIEGDMLVLEDKTGVEIRLDKQELPPTQAVTETTTTSSITSADK